MITNLATSIYNQPYINNLLGQAVNYSIDDKKIAHLLVDYIKSLDSPNTQDANSQSPCITALNTKLESIYNNIKTDHKNEVINGLASIIKNVDPKIVSEHIFSGKKEEHFNKELMEKIRPILVDKGNEVLKETVPVYKHACNATHKVKHTVRNNKQLSAAILTAGIYMYSSQYWNSRHYITDLKALKSTCEKDDAVNIKVIQLIDDVIESHGHYKNAKKHGVDVRTAERKLENAEQRLHGTAKGLSVFKNSKYYKTSTGWSNTLGLYGHKGTRKLMSVGKNMSNKISGRKGGGYTRRKRIQHRRRPNCSSCIAHYDTRFE